MVLKMDEKGWNDVRVVNARQKIYDGFAQNEALRATGPFITVTDFCAGRMILEASLVKA